MKYEIEVATKESDSTTLKGSLLEKLTAEVLGVQQYTIMNTVRVTGAEIDVLARHKINNSTILAECKAWETPIPADVITKLLGNVLLRKADAGWLITTGPLSKDAKGILDEWENVNIDNRHMLSFYTSDRIIELLLDTRIIKPCTFIECHLEDGYEQGENVLLLVTDMGRFWIVPIVAQNTGLVL